MDSQVDWLTDVWLDPQDRLPAGRVLEDLRGGSRALAGPGESVSRLEG